MRKLWPLVVVLSAGTAMISFMGCSKQSEDKLTANAVCDTTNVSYAADVVPILVNNCYECHGAGHTAGSGGIQLEGYSHIKVYADNGYLSGNISHKPGYIGMPYGRPKLPACEINTVVAWVNQGSQNN